MKVNLKTKDSMAMGILIILTIAYFWKFFFLGFVPMGGDIATYTYPPWYHHYQAKTKSQNPLLSDPVFLHYPLRELACERLKQGKITLWNPYIFCGSPLFSTNSVSFCPLNLLFLFLDPLTAYSLILILQMLLSGVFMYIFLRGSLSLGTFGALIGSIVYEFSGFFIVWLEMGILSGFLLPLILFFIDRAIIKRSIFYTGLAAIVLGIQLLSAFLQIGLFVLLAAAAYCLFRIFSQRDIKAIRYAALIFVFGIGLAAVQLIPSYELIKHSHRQPIENYRMLSPLPWQNLITFLIPDYYGNPVDYNYRFIRGKFRAIFEESGLKLPPPHPRRGIMEDNYNELCGYIGILPLILALLIFLKRDKNALFFASAALISLLLALGSPLYHLLFVGVPGCNRLIISRFIFLYTFGVAVTAALGSNMLNTKGIKRYSGGIILLFGLIIAISLYLGNKYVSADYFQFLNPSLLTPLLLLLAGGIILLNISRIRGSIIKTAILIIIVFDLFSFGLKYNPFVPRYELYPATPELKFLSDRLQNCEEKGRIAAFEHILPPSINIAYGLETPEGYDAMFPKRYDEFMNLVDPYSSGWENVKEVDYTANRKLLCLLNTKYILTSKKIAAPDLRLVFDGDVKIYEDLKALPRAFIVPQARVIKGKDAVFKELLSNKFNPEEYVILEEMPDMTHAETHRRRDAQSIVHGETSSSAGITKYTPEDVVIKATVTPQSGGFLILSDTYYPGWQVVVDGKRGNIFCADYTLRAVYLMQGEHVVEFRYSPFSFKLGGAISIGCLIMLAFMIGIGDKIRCNYSGCLSSRFKVHG
ncbi:YfhO family protein [Candidatus Desantisbacteria bacterium]|nr:YfhO family protein [Candidatus Desantisbacteria bacterium]